MGQLCYEEEEEERRAIQLFSHLLAVIQEITLATWKVFLGREHLNRVAKSLERLAWGSFVCTCTMDMLAPFLHRECANSSICIHIAFRYVLNY